MRVVFNGKNIGSAYVQYITYSECQQTETILSCLFDDQDNTMWKGVEKMVYTLDKNFMTVEGFDSKDNFVCTQIIPTRMILGFYASKEKPLDKNALTPEEMESLYQGYHSYSTQNSKAQHLKLYAWKILHLFSM